MFNKLFQTGPDPREITNSDAEKVYKDKGATFVDVRERSEWNAGHMPGSLHIPLGELTRRAGELPKDKQIITVCRSATVSLRGRHAGVERPQRREEHGRWARRVGLGWTPARVGISDPSRSTHQPDSTTEGNKTTPRDARAGSSSSLRDGHGGTLAIAPGSLQLCTSPGTGQLSIWIPVRSSSRASIWSP